jgi:hypothetical protein
VTDDLVKRVKKKTVTKYIPFPPDVMEEFEKLKTASADWRSMMFWNSDLYCNKKTEKFLNNCLANEKPPKAINGEVSAYFIMHNDKPCVLLEWDEPKGKGD